jgi:hypothetical protein
VCEHHAAALCRRDADDRPPVSVAIGRVRRRAAKADKGRELAAPNYRPREPAAAGDIDAALRAIAYATEDEG